jgi:hypothetical protein
MVDRYLQAVRYWLPVGQREDLVAELGEDIRSEIQEKEAEAGRPLGEGERRELLQRHGHPQWLASRYAPQQWLIGPAVLPIYRQVLRWTLAAMAAIFAALAVAFAALPVAPGREGLARPGFWIWHGAIWALAYSGLLTLIFAAIERRVALVKPSDPWDPARAFDLPVSPERREASEAVRIRVAALGRLAAGVLFLSWWTGAWPVNPPPGLALRLAPIWHAVWWPILVLVLWSMALAGVALVRPRRSRGRAALGGARDVLGAGIVLSLLAAGELVELHVPGAPAERVGALARTLNLSLVISLAVVGMAYVAEAVRDVRLARGQAPIRHWAFRLLAGE